MIFLAHLSVKANKSNLFPDEQEFSVYTYAHTYVGVYYLPS